ncbi:MAG TPA: Uma2 family endonuclease [Beijerinckiaceae bacterium]|jgi:Uma2 family endonuclease
MAEPRRRLMTPEEFFAWQERQEERYELVDGIPVPLRGMTGASNAHDAVAVNVIINLGNQLRGGPCRVATADTAVRTTIRGIRRPDVTVECAPIDRQSYEAHAPRLVVEVLSPSTRNLDRIRKLEEYKRLPTLGLIMFIEPGVPQVLLLRREGQGEWRDEAFTGLEAVVPLPELGASLALRDIYEGVPLDEIS